ncbi:Crp/Fnr family transcriptional regulator [Roseicyclus sp. F158]|uniref:Crp/Fnr family transcriptional regulator n=1 Tax=Tropicimonas omnivorans TaxID=3075590 RepID=A0ABU3DHA0_9RHOB|nr:Crp/Fnr family transcriptional regulator [Roseicyclus sp. F158]MDT0683095.1 Crp/Fnr family transcriptional regulator [Roseicyclus sp. F158]
MIAIMSDIWSSVFTDAPERRLDAGEVLFHRGAPSSVLFFVREGRVSLRRALSDGGALILQTAGPGEVVAPGSLWSEVTHCDAICETDVRVAVQPASRVRDWLGASPAVSAMAQAAREIQVLRARVEVLRLRRLGDRLDAYIDLHGLPESGGWVRVADWIGVTPPALYRELARRKRVP